MKSDFEEIIEIAKFIIEEAEAYKEDEAPYFTDTRINWIEGHAKTIVGITGSMKLERGES